MPEISHDRMDRHILDVAAAFTAEESVRGAKYRLTGPHLIQAYSEPMRGIDEGVLFTFNSGDAPQVVLNIEKLGGRLLLQIARLTPEKVVLLYKGRPFTDLENNYTSVTLDLHSAELTSERPAPPPITPEDVRIRNRGD